MDPIALQEETGRLREILLLIREQIVYAESELADSKRHMANINADMWENTHHLVYDFDDVVALQQRRTEIAVYGGFARHSRRELHALERMLSSPYFGRIDFAAAGRRSASSVYIGIHSLRVHPEITPRVYDWRAPISSMFYDSGVGEASYTSPSGEIKGSIVLKRQYRIRNGILEYLFDSDVKIDDEILQRELSQHAEGRMRTIISSIQKEQNVAIREDSGGNLVITGAAGSGKTSVGLHRLAYLLYRDRANLTSANIWIFSQNDIFASYISDVIPELGEEDIRRVSFPQLIAERLARYANRKDACEQMEYLLAANPAEPRFNGIRLKNNADFLGFLRGRIAGIRIRFRDVAVCGDIVCPGKALTERFAGDGNHPPATKVNRLCDYVSDRIEDYFKRNSEAIQLMLLSQMVDAKDLQAELGNRLRQEQDDARADIAVQAGLDAEKLYVKALRDYLRRRESAGDISGDTTARLGSGCLAFEDALVLLYIQLLTGEAEAKRSIRHVLIDEAQDLSVLQHEIVKLLAPNSRFTILADANQALFPYTQAIGSPVLPEIYGGNTIRLNKSYRSTRPINELAGKLIDHGETEYFDRPGQLPAVWRTDDRADAISRILKRPECQNATVGIVAKTTEEAVSLHGLLGRADIGLIRDSAAAYRGGISVLPVMLAKGMEFDCVIVADCSAAGFHTEGDKRMLYLMCTRALHRLFLVCAGELTAFLAPHGDCYTVVRENAGAVPANTILNI